MFRPSIRRRQAGTVSVKELIIVVGLIAVLMFVYVIGYTVGNRRPDSSEPTPVPATSTPSPIPSAPTIVSPAPSPSSTSTPSASPITGSENRGGEVICTMEAKICPDGTAVGRVGPNCEFAPCL